MADEPHPEVQALLTQLEEMDVPEIHELPPAEARTLLANLFADQEGVPMTSVEDRMLPGPAGELPVRIYAPTEAESTPALVWFHGGGFVLGDLETADATCRALADAVGCVVVSVDYRLAPEHEFPAPVEDCYAATEWVAEHGATVGVDTDRIAVGGDSAGGNLAAAVALVARDRDGPELVHQTLVYPATSMVREWPSYEENAEGYFLTRADMEYFGDHYFRSDLEASNPYASPLEACSHADLPPATVLTCGFDPLHDEGVAYADALAGDGVEVAHYDYDDMIHGSFGMLDEPELTRAREMLADVSTDLRDAFA